MEYVADEKDLAILEVLSEHGDYTVRQISKKTLLPPTTVHHRIGRLREAGIIKKYTVELDKKKLGFKLGAYLLISADLKMLKEKNSSQYDLAIKIRKIPGVEKVDIVTGGTDLVTKIQVRDIDELDRMLLGKIQLLEGVAKTQTMIVIHD